MRISDWSSDVCSSDVLHQRDERGAVGIVFDPLDRAFDIPFAALEIDETIALLVAAGDAARGDVSLVVAAAGLALAFGKRLDRATLVQPGAIDQDQAAPRRARRIVMLERNDTD